MDTPNQPPSSFNVRRAEPRDLAAVGGLGAQLLRAHYEFDRRRFMAPGPDPEGGYAWFLGTQLKQPRVVILVAERAGEVVGYLYAGVEPQSWKELREEAGFIHDVVVADAERRRGVATALIESAFAWFREQGVPRVLLWSAEPNVGAQRLFARIGFRRTMVEMTREMEP